MDLFLGQYFSDKEVQELLDKGLAVDGRKGGLVIGQSHKEGHISMLAKQDGYGYKFTGHIEGYEYVINSYASNLYYTYCEQFNKSIERNFHLEYNRNPKGITIIDCYTNIKGKSKFILMDKGHWVINTHSTEKYLFYLEQINNLKFNPNNIKKGKFFFGVSFKNKLKRFFKL